VLIGWAWFGWTSRAECTGHVNDLESCYACWLLVAGARRYEGGVRVQRINVPGVVRLPAFSHASIAGQQVFVSGMLGSPPVPEGGQAGAGLTVVDGGTGAQTVQALRNVETILRACGCGLEDIAKVNVYLTDMATFGEMNEAYLSVFTGDPPARITVGCSGLALGAAVEMDCIAFLPD
jgi:2-iminobutanoate/2-iminopropanoate deaminase